jgi:SAM-dependent methyltransferase
MTTERDRRDALERLAPYIERARTFSGWEFPDMHVAILEPPAWDYEALVREHAPGATSALDLGTGGGELIAGMREALPERLVATEEWRVNVPIAYRRLAPLRADVVWCRSLHLPFRDDVFDLVIDRHEELEPAEVARVLQPGGWFFTQQIGRRNWCELADYFPSAGAGNRSRMMDFGDLLDEYARGLEAAGMAVEREEEHDFQVAYESLGDFLFMLLITPWTIPDLDVERDIDALLALERDRTTDHGLEMTWGRFLIAARQPRP